jgi:hypothetical protein
MLTVYSFAVKVIVVVVKLLIVRSLLRRRLIYSLTDIRITLLYSLRVL